MHEAAEILGIKPSLVFNAASKLHVSFHGRRGRKFQSAAGDANGAAKPKKRNAMHAPVNGKAVAHAAASPRMQRRCLSCNRIFKPVEISDLLCDDCEYPASARPQGNRD
jgi:hypothetical protein